MKFQVPTKHNNGGKELILVLSVSNIRVSFANLVEGGIIGVFWLGACCQMLENIAQGTLILGHKIVLSFHYIDLPVVWHIQMKVCISVYLLRSAENVKLLTLVQLICFKNNYIKLRIEVQTTSYAFIYHETNLLNFQ